MNNISNTKQDLSKENSRSRILESALQIFSTKGFEGASVSDIVQAAGVTKPTLYYLKADNEIIKRSFNKKKLLAIKQKIEEGIIDIEDVKKQYILESDIELWMEEIE